MQIIICEYFGFLARRFYMRKRGTSRKPVSVRPSVRPSHLCIIPKRRVHPVLHSSKGNPTVGRLNRDWVEKIRIFAKYLAIFWKR